ncbi:sugar kinase, partial [Agromyces soli]
MSNAPHPEILAVGETMALVAPALAERLEHACDFRVEAGGAEANVASHLAALGRRAAWAGRVGDDALGRRIVGELAARGVDVRFVETDASAPTGVYFKDPGAGVIYHRAGSAAAATTAGFADGLPLDGVRYVHLSGITPALSAGCDVFVDALIDRAAVAGVPVSFDVNHRPALWAREAQDGDAVAARRLREIAARADLVFVGLDEAERLWGVADADAVRALLPEPRLLVVKDGARRASEFSRDGVAHVPARRAEVVEAIGAGDAFAAGYLAALLDDEPAEARLAAGHARAVTVLGGTGDFPRGDAPPRGVGPQRGAPDARTGMGQEGGGH